MKKLFLFDAYALIYRAHFAFIRSPRINSKGENTSAVFGFTNTVLEIIEKENPTHLAIVFDPKGDTFRHQEFETYKANRQETPEDIKIAVPRIEQLAKGLGISMVTVDNYEADDVIGTIAKQAVKDGYTVYMMTPDKDYGQLVEENIYQYRPGYQGKPAEIYGVQEIKDKWGIDDPLKVIDVLGLMGDSVDNIPGIPGIGEKTAVKLINEWGSVENLIANAASIKGKMGDNIREFAQQGLLSKRLATIVTDIEIEFHEESYTVKPKDLPLLRQLFEELEFRQLGRKILGDDSPSNSSQETTPQKKAASPQLNLFSSNDQVQESVSSPSNLKTLADVQVDYQLIESTEDINKLIKYLSDFKELSFDTETTGLDPMTAEIIGFSFCVKPMEAFYVPFIKGDQESIKKMNLFKDLLENESITKIGSNIKYDMGCLKKYNIDIKGQLFDTVLAHYLLEPDQRHGMDILSANYLGYKPISIEELIGKKGKSQLNMGNLPPEQIKDYACEDADIVLQLKAVLQPLLIDTNAESVFKDIECPLIPVLCAMETEGIKIDEKGLQEYSKELAEDIKAVESEVYQMAGITFNMNSPSQLGEILFDRLKLDPKAKRTAKSKQYATGEEVLQALAVQHPIAAKILEHRGMQKLKSTYVDALPLIMNKQTGRIHTNYNQSVAATGRLSSTDPNLQNIPIKTERGREIRKAFIPKNDDYLILSADYSQIELRLIAEMSKEHFMIEAFKNGEDIHKATAAKVYGVPLEEVTKEMRNKAKMVNFGIIYGISAFGLSQRLGVSRAEAAELIASYNTSYPRIKAYMDEQIQFAKENGFVETIKGRRRYLRDINSANFTTRGFAERNAINAPIQGSAADLIKIAMINIYKKMTDLGLKSKMLLQVHDELVFDCYRPEQAQLTDLVKTEMQNAIQGLETPIEAETGIGQNWLEAH